MCVDTLRVVGSLYFSGESSLLFGILKDFKEEEARKQNKCTANCILVVLQLF